MGFRRKKSDPIAQRERALKEQIDALEGQIKKLNSSLEQKPPPRWRSTALPHSPSAAVPGARAAQEPIFEEMDPQRIQETREAPAPPAHFPERVRGKSIYALIRRNIQNYFRSLPPTNPKLVSYLAAGSLQGLRPMRYEKRVARNRFLVLVAIFLAVLYGIFRAFSSR